MNGDIKPWNLSLGTKGLGKLFNGKFSSKERSKDKTYYKEIVTVNGNAEKQTSIETERDKTVVKVKENGTIVTETSMTLKSNVNGLPKQRTPDACSKLNAASDSGSKQHLTLNTASKHDPTSDKNPKEHASSKGHATPDASSKEHSTSNASSKGHATLNASSKGHATSNASSKGHATSDASSKGQATSNSSSKGHATSNASSKGHATSDSGDQEHAGVDKRRTSEYFYSDDSDYEEHLDSNGLPHSPTLRVCQYKLKCMALDQNTMNHSKVHVDESEPTGPEEAPFESRDVNIRNGCWITDEYDVSEVLLGRGKFGEVKQCKEKKTGRDLAAKFIEIQGPQDRFDVVNEVEMMKALQHPRLLQLYDVFVKRNNFCLVLELIAGGELFERVINDDFILTEKACVMFMRQICEGILFMHNNKILHLDLKPENILCLTREGNRIKIIDFGLARRYNPEHELRILFGTPEFMAPEQANFEIIYPSTDMWSVGIICYILLSGLSPFLGDSETETIGNVTEGKWDFKAEEFQSISEEAKDFISKLIVVDQSKRMTATECMEHKWLRRSSKRERLPNRSLSTKRLKKFVYRRKWQKAVNAMLALKRMGVKL